jgi:hypothetical protein
LAADRSQRPWLIKGEALKAFLESRRAQARCRLRIGEIYCLPCRAPKVPAGNMAEYLVRTPQSGSLLGICPDCDQYIYRMVRRIDLDRIRANLDVAIPKANPRLVGSDQPCETVTFRPRTRTHVKA